jgi:hypothetical protein
MCSFGINCTAKYINCTAEYINCTAEYINCTAKYINCTAEYIKCTAKYINRRKEYRLNPFCSASVTGPHKCVSAVSVVISIIVIIIISIDIHIIDYGQCGWQRCGGWIACWQHGVGLVCNILMYLMW